MVEPSGAPQLGKLESTMSEMEEREQMGQSNSAPAQMPAKHDFKVMTGSPRRQNTIDGFRQEEEDRGHRENRFKAQEARVLAHDARSRSNSAHSQKRGQEALDRAEVSR